MAMDDLLKEAIADAKAVRETALANARASLEEQFAPRLQSMLNATLQNEADDFGDEEEMEAPTDEVPVDDMGSDDLGEPAGDEFGEETPEEFQISGKVTLTPVEGEEGVEDMEMDFEETPEGEGEAEEELEETDEYAFESIIRDLEEEASSKDDVQIDEAFSDKARNQMKSKEKAGSGFAKAKTTDGKFSSVKEEVDEPVEEAEVVDEEVNLSELIAELKNEYEESNSSNNAVELNEVKRNLAEHRKVIVYLRSKLNEVNLLNAKLLFTNRLFKNHSMNEAQKLRVIETLDRATTLKECKLVYSTLEEAYNGMKQTVTSGPARKIVESMASRTINSTKPSAVTVEKSVINEGADLAARFKKLAGIK